MHPTELLKRRLRLGLTQAELAAKLGVTANTVSRWERGTVGIPPMLRLILEGLDDAAIRERYENPDAARAWNEPAAEEKRRRVRHSIKRHLPPS